MAFGYVIVHPILFTDFQGLCAFSLAPHSAQCGAEDMWMLRGGSESNGLTAFFIIFPMIISRAKICIIAFYFSSHCSLVTQEHLEGAAS